MKCRKSLWFQGAALVLIAITMLLPPGAGAQNQYKTLHRFKGGTDGEFMYAGLVFDQKGNLYGATAGGGAGGNGTVFMLQPKADGSWTESVLYSFTGGTDGGNPETDLIFDQAGNLYGTTKWGGKCAFSDGCGVVFELKRQTDGSWVESVLHRFSRRDGFVPTAGLIFDAAGSLYGTTVAGGDLSLHGGSGCGVGFKLAPNSNGKWTETELHRFLDRPGDSPFAGLIFDGSGNLYGTTWGNGTSTFGSVFEVTP